MNGAGKTSRVNREIRIWMFAFAGSLLILAAVVAIAFHQMRASTIPSGPPPLETPTATPVPTPEPTSTPAPYQPLAAMIEPISDWPAKIAPERRPLVQDYYNQLLALEGYKWGSVGAILEALAWLDLNRRLAPDKFHAIVNLKYFDVTGRTLGELDVLIWNLELDRAEFIYEAVISEKLHRNRVASMNQVKRFQTAIAEKRVAKILSVYEPDRHFEPSQFEDAQYGALGSLGALALGYDVEINITRPEADFLQAKLFKIEKALKAAKTMTNAPPSDDL